MGESRQVTGAAGAGVEHSPVSDGLRWRSIGPFRGGRVVAVAGHPTDQNVFYFGACAGGVWKTTDRGTYWENVSDGYFSTAAVAQSRCRTPTRTSFTPGPANRVSA